jgi:hypothetical protein
MRARIAAAMSAGAVAAVIGCAGCSAHPQPSPARSSAAAPVPVALPARSLPSPVCSTAVATAQRRAHRDGQGPGHPVRRGGDPDGRWAFVALVNSVEVLRLGPSLAPVKVRAIPCLPLTRPWARR